MMEFLHYLSPIVMLVIAIGGFVFREVINRRLDNLEKTDAELEQELKAQRQAINDIHKGYVTKNDMKDMKEEIITRMNEKFEDLKVYLKQI